MTAGVQERGSVERLLGTVGETMTRAVVLLAADMPADWALRRLERQAVSGAPVVDQGRVVGVITGATCSSPSTRAARRPARWPGCGSGTS